MPWHPARHPRSDLSGNRLISVGIIVCALAPSWALSSTRADEVFVARGEHGELSFSDEQAPGARKVIVRVPEPAPDAIEETERYIEQTLRVAKALEQSRLAREKTRADPPQRVVAVAVGSGVGAAGGRDLGNDVSAYYFVRPAYPYLPLHEHPHRPPADRPEPPVQDPAPLTAPLLRRGATPPDRTNWLRKAEG